MLRGGGGGGGGEGPGWKKAFKTIGNVNSSSVW